MLSPRTWKRQASRTIRTGAANVLSQINREHNRRPNYEQYRFYRTARCESDRQKHIFKRVLKQLLRKSKRLLKNILEQDPELVDVKNEVDMLDIQTRWSLNKTAVIIFKLHGDKPHIHQ